MKLIAGSIPECCPELGHSRGSTGPVVGRSGLLMSVQFVQNPINCIILLKIWKFLEPCSFAKLQAVTLESAVF